MGRLLKASERPSAYSVKKTDWWARFEFMLDMCVVDADLDEVEQWLATQVMNIPGSWDEPIQDAVAWTRDHIASENIRTILRERYDFT